MKFVCDKCHTKYSIADERVHGRVLKIRCKSCSNVITVREEHKAAAAAAASTAAPSSTGMRPRPMQHTQPIDRLIEDSFGNAAPAPGGMFGEEGEHTMISQGPPGDGAGPGPSEEWYVSFDGEQEGPMSLEAAHARVRAERPKGREAYCWNPTFFVWKPVEEVAEFAPALGAARLPAPPAIPAAGARGGAGRTSSPASSRSPSPVGTSSSTGAGASSAATGPSASASGGTGGRRAGLAVGAVATAEALPEPDLMPQLPPQVTRPETRSALRGTPSRTPEGPYAKAPADNDRAGALSSSQAAALPDKPRSGAPPIPGSSTGPAKAIPAPSSTKASGKAPAIPDAAAASTKSTGKAPAIPDAAVTSSKKASGKAPAIPEPQPHAAPTTPSPLAPPVEVAAPTPAPKVDTGPTPLPPPGGQPSDDLVISEPSGLFNLAHIAADLGRTKATPISSTTPARPAQPTPAPARASAAAAPAGGLSDDVIAAGPVVPNAAPVVVVAGPAVHKTPPWVKWAAIGGAVVSLGLGGALIAVLMKKDAGPVVTPQPTEPPVTRRAEDTPIAVADPGAVPTSAAVAAPKDPPKTTPNPGGARKVATGPKTTAPAPDKSGKGLSESQRNLAALYAEGDDKGTPREIPAVDRSSRSSGGQVSQNAILGVVTQNRRSLNLCYDRVLKRDSSLKRARLVTHVKVGISGSVVGVSIADPEYAKSEIGTCITQAVKHWHFPANDSEYETEFPIILQAD